jgi:hypothetical protein
MKNIIYSITTVVLALLITKTNAQELWGTTTYGGDENGGVIYKTNKNGENFEVAYDFKKNRGLDPVKNLCLASNGKVYGIVSSGAVDFNEYYEGGIYSYDTETKEYELIFGFLADEVGNDTTGVTPVGGIIQASNGKLYGVCSEGGLNKGILYELNPNTQEFIKLYDFSYSSDEGYFPSSGLLEVNGKLYGSTMYGGTGGTGSFYEYDIETGTVNNLLVLDYDSVGYSSYASPVYYNGHIYGLCRSGGEYNDGTLFSYNVNTGNIEIYPFEESSLGANPTIQLTVLNNKLYGVTKVGGVNGDGVLYEFNPDTKLLEKRIDFNSFTGVRDPNSNLVAHNNLLYGLVSYSANSGTMFSYNPINNLVSFSSDSAMGNSKYHASLFVKDGTVFGIRYDYSGNYWDGGVFFEFEINQDTYSKHFHFGASESGVTPLSPLTQVNNKLYGITNHGGANNRGVLFEFDLLSSKYNKLKDLSNEHTPVGLEVYSAYLTYFNSDLYWTSTDQSGKIFKYNIEANILEAVFEFPKSNELGNHPTGHLTEHLGKFYGLTERGGDFDVGVLFEFDPASNELEVHKHFEDDDITGSAPTGKLTKFNNLLYGVSGAMWSPDVVFVFNPSTNTTSYISGFGDVKDTQGNYEQVNDPLGNLIEFEGKLYGITDGGEIFHIDGNTIVYNAELWNYHINYSLSVINDKIFILGYDGVYSFTPTINNIVAKRSDFEALGIPSDHNNEGSIVVWSYTGVDNELRTKAGNFNLYPNPTKGEVNIKLPKELENENLTVKVLNTLGQVLSEEKVNAKSSIKLNTHLKSGMYYVQLSSNEGNVSIPFVVE